MFAKTRSPAPERPWVGQCGETGSDGTSLSICGSRAAGRFAVQMQVRTYRKALDSSCESHKTISAKRLIKFLKQKYFIDINKILEIPTKKVENIFKEVEIEKIRNVSS